MELNKKQTQTTSARLRRAGRRFAPPMWFVCVFFIDVHKVSCVFDIIIAIIIAIIIKPLLPNIIRLLLPPSPLYWEYTGNILGHI